MRYGKLNDLTIFVEVARAGGFRAAAAKLKMGAGSVSEAIQRFEDRLGLRLIERTTRAISLTKAGETLYRRSLPAINELDAALGDIHDLGAGLGGTLRLSAPAGAGSLFLDALIADFSKAHPTLAIELIYDEKKIDLVTSGVDAAIRTETLLDPDTYAIPIGPRHKMAIVASPQYLAKTPSVKSPRDIAHHDGVCFAFGSSETLAPWIFRTADGPLTVMPSPRIISNTVTSVLNHAQAGLGLAYVFSAAARPAIAGGHLIELLAESTAPLPRFSLNYLSKRNMPARLGALISHVRNTQ